MHWKVKAERAKEEVAIWAEAEGVGYLELHSL